MKVKFGDLTVRQLAGICSQYPDCRGCPLLDDAVTVQCELAMAASYTPIEKEIDLPDGEVKEDA